MIAPPRPPAHDELELLIKEARERQLRRRLLSAAGLAVIAALGLSIYAFVIGGKVDHVAQLPGKGGRAAAPLCRTSQLSATAGLNGAGGTMIGPVKLTNTGAGACSLPHGRPQVRIVWQGGILAARETGGMRVWGEPPARWLAPHSTAAVYVDWSNWCGKPGDGTIIRPTFELRWGGGPAVDAPSQAMSPPRCGSSTAGSSIAVSRPVRN
jgi:hypothetical protein